MSFGAYPRVLLRRRTVACTEFTILELMVQSSPSVNDCVRSMLPEAVVMRMFVGEKNAGA